MDKISVDDFCNQYQTYLKNKDKRLQDYLKKHIVVDYVPYLNKEALCTWLVNVTSHVKDEEREFIKINSSHRYLMFVMRLIELYTDLDIVFEDATWIDQYDKLNKIGAMNELISCIPEVEYKEFLRLLDMKLDDLIINEYSVTAILYNLKESISLSDEIITSSLKALGIQSNDKTS